MPIGLGADLPLLMPSAWHQLTVAQLEAQRRCDLPGSGLVIRRKCYLYSSWSKFLPSRDGMLRLSRPRAIVSKFHGHRNYALAQMSATGFEPETLDCESMARSTRLQCQLHVNREWLSASSSVMMLKNLGVEQLFCSCSSEFQQFCHLTNKKPTNWWGRQN